MRAHLCPCALDRRITQNPKSSDKTPPVSVKKSSCAAKNVGITTARTNEPPRMRARHSNPARKLQKLQTYGQDALVEFLKSLYGPSRPSQTSSVATFWDFLAAFLDILGTDFAVVNLLLTCSAI